MHWFKHDTDANADNKLQNVLLDYGLEGYGLYWYCIELIAGRVDKDKFTFELEHDARIIARNTGSTPQKVEEMMRYFVKVGLFENSDGVVTCLKLAKRLDKSMTSNPEMRRIIEQLKLRKENTDIENHDGVMTASCDSMTESEKIMQDKIRLDQNREEEIREENKELSVSTKHDETVKNIFAVWCEKMNSPRSRLDANRKRLIVNALKKYTENDLIAAITGCAMSPFHMGINPDGKKYNGLDLILRNAEKIEQFIGFSTNPPAQRQQQAGYDFNDTSWVKDFGDTY